LVALANAEGGTILIGVDDLGHVQGVDDPKRATDNVVEAIIEVQSPGPFPPPVTPQNIREEHQLRNPRIAQAFKDYGLIEKFGNGIDRVFEEIEAHPFKPRLPTFHNTGASVIVTLYGAVLPPEETGIPLHVEPARFGLNKRQSKALEYLQAYDWITRSDYCRICGVGSTEAYRELNEMLSKGLLTRQGKGRGTYYVLAL